MSDIELTSPQGYVRIGRKGAQVLEARWADRALLWLSPQAPQQAAAAGSAVRGGVPICFPWFGKDPYGRPAHGFARNRDWSLLAHTADSAVFALDDEPDTCTLWPHRFRAELDVSVDDGLRFAFRVTNTDAQPFQFTYALHSYLAADLSSQCQVEGLDGCLRHEDGQVIGAQHGEVEVGGHIDAVFDGVPDRLVLRDAHRAIAVDADGMTNAIVWNPGRNEMPDVGDRWREFVCVERGRVGENAVVLAPGQRYDASMRLSLL